MRVTVPIGVACAPGAGGKNPRPKTVICFLGAPFIEVLRGMSGAAFAALYQFKAYVLWVVLVGGSIGLALTLLR